MPSDVKCGLLVGIAGLVVVSALFFRKSEPDPIDQQTQSAESTSVQPQPSARFSPSERDLPKNAN